jgi:hypothetical protein
VISCDLRKPFHEEPVGTGDLRNSLNVDRIHGQIPVMFATWQLCRDAHPCMGRLASCYWLGCGEVHNRVTSHPSWKTCNPSPPDFPFDSRRSQPPNAITIFVAGAFSCRRLRARATGSSALSSAARVMSFNGNSVLEVRSLFKQPDAGLAAASVPPGFPPSNFINPDSIGQRLINCNIVSAVVTSIFLALRLYTRIRIVRQPGWDDGM